MPERDPTTGSVTYEQYAQRRHALEQIRNDQAKSFDKGILSLSSGALALSLLFVEKIASLNTKAASPTLVNWTKPFLVGAWVLFVLAMLSTLVSFVSSQAAHLQTIREWDKVCTTGESCPCENRGDLWTRRLNKLSIIFFIVGVTFLLVFATGNL